MWYAHTWRVFPTLFNTLDKNNTSPAQVGTVLGIIAAIGTSIAAHVNPTPFSDWHSASKPYFLEWVLKQQDPLSPPAPTEEGLDDDEDVNKKEKNNEEDEDNEEESLSLSSGSGTGFEPSHDVRSELTPMPYSPKSRTVPIEERRFMKPLSSPREREFVCVVCYQAFTIRELAEGEGEMEPG